MNPPTLKPQLMISATACVGMLVSVWSWNYFASPEYICIWRCLVSTDIYLWSIIACQPRPRAGGNCVILPGSDNTEMNLNYPCCWQDSSVNTGPEHKKCKHLVLSLSWAFYSLKLTRYIDTCYVQFCSNEDFLEYTSLNVGVMLALKVKVLSYDQTWKTSECEMTTCRCPGGSSIAH